MSNAELTALEDLALTIALSQLSRGELPMPGIATACVIALARILGRTLPVVLCDVEQGDVP